jgi:hypothetical protein
MVLQRVQSFNFKIKCEVVEKIENRQVGSHLYPVPTKIDFHVYITLI